MVFWRIWDYHASVMLKRSQAGSNGTRKNAVAGVLSHPCLGCILFTLFACHLPVLHGLGIREIHTTHARILALVPHETMLARAGESDDLSSYTAKPQMGSFAISILAGSRTGTTGQDARVHRNRAIRKHSRMLWRSRPIARPPPCFIGNI